MEIINSFKSKKYVVWNINVSKKIPIVGTNDLGWSKITHDDVKQYWNDKSNSWGFRTGIQENGDYIIGLDFDMWYKCNNQYIASENTRKLFSDFELLNPNNEGVFTSSTSLNKNVLCDISKCDNLIKKLDDLGKGKIQNENYHLEILNNFNMVLPPTMTKCKLTGKMGRKRHMLSDTFVLKVEPDGSVEKFIFDYINNHTNSKTKSKTQYNTKKAKNATIEYISYIEDNDKNYIKKCELLNPFLKALNKSRTDDYNNWWKIGYALKSDFEDAGLDSFILFSQKTCKNDKEKEQVKNDCIKHWKKWDDDKYGYDGLNTNYILYLCRLDNEAIFGDLLLKYQSQLSDVDFKEKVDKFELNVRKVLEPAIWIKKHRKTNQWDYCDTQQILHIYSELGFSKDFLNRYINDYQEKNFYDFIDFIPDINFKETDDKDLKTFNLFDGFEIRKHEVKNVNDTTIDTFIKHLKFICDGDENAYTMLINWLSHLIFNTINKSNICIILKGLEGQGKTTLYRLIEKLIGKKYCVSTATPQETIFSRFNDILINKICVNIDEPDYYAFTKSFETFKNLITDDTILIETKNKPTIEFKNNYWFLVTTNNDKLFNISQTDRRFYFINSGFMETNENKKKYFDRFYDMINNPDEVRAIFDYLQKQYDNNKDFDFEKHQKNNKTNFHQSLMVNSKNPFWEFVQEFIEDEQHGNNNIINVSPKDFMTEWKQWARNAEMKDGENGKSIKNKLIIVDNDVYKKIADDSNSRRWKYCIDKTKFINYMKKHNYYSHE